MRISRRTRRPREEKTLRQTALTEPLQLLGTCAVPVSVAFNTVAMAAFLYRCPKTRLRVQGWVADEPIQSEKHNYEAMNCLACGGVHLVNPVGGKTINEDDKKFKLIPAFLRHRR